MNLRYPLTMLEAHLQKFKISRDVFKKVEPLVLHPELDEIIRQYEQAISILQPRSENLLKEIKDA